MSAAGVATVSRPRQRRRRRHGRPCIRRLAGALLGHPARSGCAADDAMSAWRDEFRRTRTAPAGAADVDFAWDAGAAIRSAAAGRRQRWWRCAGRGELASGHERDVRRRSATSVGRSSTARCRPVKGASSAGRLDHAPRHFPPWLSGSVRPMAAAPRRRAEVLAGLTTPSSQPVSRRAQPCRRLPGGCNRHLAFGLRRAISRDRPRVDLVGLGVPRRCPACASVTVAALVEQPR